MANIYRLEYETKDMNYTVHIAARDMEQARLFLLRSVRQQLRINSMSELCRIDVITKEAFPDIIIEGNEREGAEKNMGNVKTWVCPFCGQNDFKNEMGLKIHIGRSHK